MLHAYKIKIKGIVQGVGFRPFIYLLAQENAITGWVKNTGAGVTIFAQGTYKNITYFVGNIESKIPPLAKIDEFIVNDVIVDNSHQDFRIIATTIGSSTTKAGADSNICPECLHELFDLNSRYYLYPFINCTHCGPRYSVINQLPYDRPSTALKPFPLCQECQSAYENPFDRRYHAQATACSKCGPKISNSFQEISNAILNGEIVALKSTGGFHLIVDGHNDSAIKKLRKRKGRPTKPFALMALNIESIKQYVILNKKDKTLLTNRSAPIVIMTKNKDQKLPIELAPGLNELGIMLPSTPLHYLLFYHLLNQPTNINFLQQANNFVLVMTSANYTGGPIAYKNEEAHKSLISIADKIIDFDRDITTRIDDSVIRSNKNHPIMIRRSRGYAPKAIKLPYSIPNTLALGGFLKNTICYTRADEAFVSQYIGDLDHPKTIDSYHQIISHLKQLSGFKPELIVHDLHPNFYSSLIANDFGLPSIGIQHHQAHMGAVLAENNITEPTIGIALDGFGIGENGDSLGSELLLFNNFKFKRLAQFEPLLLVGGDKAVKEPWRIALAYLWQHHALDVLPEHIKKEKSINNILELLEAGLYQKTSSAGRLFDAVSALIGIINNISYEGEAAILLETSASSYFEEAPIIASKITTDGNIDFSKLVLSLSYFPKDKAAMIFHQSLIFGLSEWIIYHANNAKINTIALTGGCFMNKILLNGLKSSLTKLGLTVITANELPCNDGGLSYGQAWLAGNIYKTK